MTAIMLTVWEAQMKVNRVSPCEFSPFEGNSSGSEAAEGKAVAMVEPYQHEPFDSHSSSSSDSSEGSSGEESLRGFSTLNGRVSDRSTDTVEIRTPLLGK